MRYDFMIKETRRVKREYVRSDVEIQQKIKERYRVRNISDTHQKTEDLQKFLNAGNAEFLNQVKKSRINGLVAWKSLS